jgi:hypothetical protein
MKIAILSRSAHISKLNGFSVFLKTLIEEYPGIYFHILTEKEPKKEAYELFNYPNVLIINNEKHYSQESKAELSFKTFLPSDATATKQLEFQNVLLESLSTNVYDFVLIHKFDTFLTILNLGLMDVLNVIYYTHDANLPHLRPVASGLEPHEMDLVFAYSQMSNLIIGTQSELNKRSIIEHFPKAKVKVLPIFLEANMTIEGSLEKSGCLVVGGGSLKRWELAVTSIHEAGLKPIMISNSVFKKSIEDFMKETGIPIEVHYDVTGENKLRIFQKAKVLVSCSKMETFGINVVEGLHHCNVVLLKDNPWVEAFEGFVKFSSKEDLAIEIKKAHESPLNRQDVFAEFSHEARLKWMGLLYLSESFNTIKKSKLKDYLEQGGGSTNDYIKNFLGRSDLGCIDLVTIYSNLFNFSKMDSLTESFLLPKGKTITLDSFETDW